MDEFRTNGNGSLIDFHHVKFWVSNAKQTAQWYCICYGFVPFLSKMDPAEGLVSHAVRMGRIIFVFESPFRVDCRQDFCKRLLNQGDSVTDVALEVDDLGSIFKKAQQMGANVIKDIWEEKDDHGSVTYATIQSCGDVAHTLLQRHSYNGQFLPNYRQSDWQLPILDTLPSTQLHFIDHIVGAQRLYEMENTVRWYQECLELHRFWSVDDLQVTSEYSGLHVSVVTNKSHSVKITIVEPAIGTKRAKSQIQEYLDYNGGPGVQHVAFSTEDIVKAIDALTSRGAEFLKIPKTYYRQLRDRLADASIKVDEDLDALERLGILLDFDENGYLLQIFTKPVQDRPTLFLEIIQRHNHKGFGAGNIKALFEAVELEQNQRGNLFDDASNNN